MIKTINCMTPYPVTEEDVDMMIDSLDRAAKNRSLGKIIYEYYVNDYFPETDQMVFGIVRDYESASIDGGYCSRCDTVWSAPGKCNCDLGNDAAKQRIVDKGKKD